MDWTALSSAAAFVAAVAAAVIAPSVTVWMGRRQVKVSEENVRLQLEDNARAAEAQARANENALDRQIRATVVSTNRQRWINDLRNDIAEFISTHEAMARIVLESAHRIISEEKEVRANQLDSHKMMILTRVRLRLNPVEQDHQELLKLMTELPRVAGEEGDNGYEEIVKISHKILKDEWLRVKQGE